MSFEVKIFDRYQRLVNESVIQSSDKIWDGMNIDGSDFVKTDFYFMKLLQLNIMTHHTLGEEINLLVQYI